MLASSRWTTDTARAEDRSQLDRNLDVEMGVSSVWPAIRISPGVRARTLEIVSMVGNIASVSPSAPDVKANLLGKRMTTRLFEMISSA